MLRSGGVRWVLPVAVGTVGLFMAHHPMILSRMALIQTDPGDSRLINYILEHTYRWAHREAGHRDFWSPPFFFPATNVGAYSDVLLTIGPIYWMLREFGMATDSAFQGWMMIISALNFGTALVLFRRGFGFAPVSATAGAFLLSFGAPRINQLGHHQLVPIFYGLATLFALARLFRDVGPVGWRRWAWWQIAVLGVVAQLYAAFYPGWFLILGLGLAAAWAAALPASRGPFLRRLRGDAPAILVGLVVGLGCLGPFLTHYLAAARELGSRDYADVRSSILHPWSWLYVGPDNWLWGGMARLSIFRSQMMEQEKRVGLGLITPILCVVGLFLARDRPWIRVAALAAATSMLLSVHLPGEWIANGGVATAMVVAALLFHDRTRPGPRLAVLGALLCLATFERFPSWRVIGLNLFTATLCLAEAFRFRREPARIVAPLIVMVWVCLSMFDLAVMGIGMALVGLGVAAAEIIAPGDRATTRLLGVAAWLAFLVFLTYPDRPGIALFGVATPAILGITRSRNWRRPADRSMVIATVVALWAIVLLENQESLWYHVYERVPGAKAIRAVGRIGLLVLIPASIGCAAFFATPWARRHRRLAGLLGLACLVEQGVTTPAFDKRVDRERVAALARQVDPAAAAFYLHSNSAVFYVYQIDAMWMSMVSGVPTINGYSGGTPRGWYPLMQVDMKDERTDRDPITPREALARWLLLHRLNPEQIQAIGDLD